MTPRKTILLAALISAVPTAFAMAQSQTTPGDPTTHSTAAQEATGKDQTESPNPNSRGLQDSTSPAAASSPHQQKVTHMANKQAMKDCVAKQKSDNSSLSTADAKKACKAQMKGSG